MAATWLRSGATTIRPFHVDVPEETLVELRRRVAATLWPGKELVSDRSQGVQLATIQELARYWAAEHDWRACEAKLNALPQFRPRSTNSRSISSTRVAARARVAADHLPRLAWLDHRAARRRRAAHRPDRARRTRGGCVRSRAAVAARVWLLCTADGGRLGSGSYRASLGELMNRLGYTRYVAQGGDQGAAVTDYMAIQAPSGLLGIHLNFLRRPPQEVAAAVFGGGPDPEGLTEEERAAFEPSRPSSGKATSSSRGRRPRRSATRSAIHRSAWRPGSSTTTPIATRRSRARFSMGIPPGSDPRQDPGQHHALLGDTHRSVGGPDLLGGRTRSGPCRGTRAPRRSRSQWRSRSSPMRSSRRRAAGQSGSIPT